LLLLLFLLFLFREPDEPHQLHFDLREAALRQGLHHYHLQHPVSPAPFLLLFIIIYLFYHCNYCYYYYKYIICYLLLLLCIIKRPIVQGIPRWLPASPAKAKALPRKGAVALVTCTFCKLT